MKYRSGKPERKFDIYGETMKNKKRLFGALVIIILALTMIATLAACGEEETVQYTVTLKSGFDDQVTTQTLNEGEVFTLPASPFTRDGYTFDYWTEEGTTYPNQVGTPIPVYRNMTFVAHWTENYVPDVPEDFTVTVKDGYGSGQITAVVTEGEEYVLPAADTFTRSEYTFGGWQVGDSVLAAGDSVTITANTEIIAVWNEIPKYNVSVLKGYGDNAPIATYVVTSGGSYTLPEMTLDYADHNFLGYADLSGDLTEYLAAGTVIENITSNKTFVAMWEEITYYTVYLKKTADATGTDVDNSNRVTEGGSFVLPECNFVNAGYVFKAWLYDGEEVQPGFTIENVVSDIDVIAVWELAEEPQPEQYTVTFTNGQYFMAGGTYTEDTGYTIPLESDGYFSKADYKLIGWTVAGDDSGKVYKPGETYNGNANVVFEAVLEKIVYYTVTLSDGMGNTYSVELEAGSEYRLPDNSFDGEGKIFVNWLINNEAKEPGAVITVNENITVTANWREQHKYNVTYDAGYEGGTTTSVAVLELAAPYYVLSGALNRAGYRFDGWKTKDGTLYEAGSVYPVTEDVTFTAAWTVAITYEITFINGDKIVDGYPHTQNYGGYTPVPSLSGIEGYTFLGWAIEGSTDIVIAPGKDNYQATSDVTFVAVWEQNKYTVSFLDLNGAPLEAPQTVLWGEHPTVPEVETEIIKDLQTVSSFNGWRSSVDSGLYSSDNIPAATADVIYKAEYTDSTRYYPIVLGDTEAFRYYTLDNREITAAKVEYEEDFSFRVVKKSPAVNDTNAKVYGNGTQLKFHEDDQGGYYTLSFNYSGKGEIEIRDYKVTTYFIEVENVDEALVGYEYTVNGEAYSGGELDYGSEVRIEFWGGDYHSDDVPPALEINGNRISSDEYESSGAHYVYSFQLESNTHISVLAGEEKVIRITYVDILDNEYGFDWKYSYGPARYLFGVAFFPANPAAVGSAEYNIAYADPSTLYAAYVENALIVYEGFEYDGTVFEDLAGNMSKRIITKDMQKQMATDLWDTPFYPSPDENAENKFYILYTPEITGDAKISMPFGADNVMWQYKPNGSTEWEDWVNMSEFTSKTYISHVPDEYGRTNWYTLSTSFGIITPSQSFNDGDVVRLAFTLDGVSSADDMPIMYNSYNKNEEIKATAATNADGTYYYYEFAISNIMPYNSYYFEKNIHTVNVNYEASRFFKVYYGVLGSLGKIVYTTSAAGSYIQQMASGEEFSMQLKFLKITMPEIENILDTDGTIKAEYVSAFVEVEGQDVVPVLSVEEDEYSYQQHIYITISIKAVTSDITVTIKNPEDLNITTNGGEELFKINKDSFNVPLLTETNYDWYLDGTKLEDFRQYNGQDAPTFFEWSVGEVLEARIKDGMDLTFLESPSYDFCVRPTGSDTIVIYMVRSGYVSLEISEDGKSVYLTLLSTDNDKFYFMTAPSAGSNKEADLYGAIFGSAILEHDESKCATSAEEGVSMVEAPVAADSKGEATFKVTVPLGYIPTLWIDPLNATGYYAVTMEEETEEGDLQRTFTATVTGIEGKSYWYITVEKEIYEITFVYGNESIVINVVHGTLIRDIEGLPTHFIQDLGDGMYRYEITAWRTEAGSLADSVLQGGKLIADYNELSLCAALFTAEDGTVTSYESLADALAALVENHARGTLDIIYAMEGQTLASGNFKVPEGVTLRLPYAKDGYGRRTAETTEEANPYYADPENGFVALTIEQGATLTVYGVLSVGGVVGYPHTTAPSSESASIYQGMTSGAHAVLMLNGNLVIENGGVLDVNGYIVGDTDPETGALSGLVEVKAGGESKLPFIVKDYRGGSNTTQVFGRGLAPFNIYEIPNILVNYTIHAGATETAYAMLYASDTFNEAEVTAIGVGGIINLNAGGRIEKLTVKIANPRGIGSEFEFRTSLKIYGGGKDGAMTLDLGLLSVDTSGKYLAVPYTYQSVTLYDGDYTISNLYKIMPGASLEIADSASLTINEANGKAGIVIYDLSTGSSAYVEGDATNLSPILKYPADPNADGNRKGQLIVSGELIVYGFLAGSVTAGKEGAILRVRSESSAYLNVTAKEAIYYKGSSYTELYLHKYYANITTKNGEIQCVIGSAYEATTSENGQIIWK